MSDSFEHPDGHHYRFLGFGPDAMTKDVGFYSECDDGTMTPMHKAQTIPTDSVFERVEPPIWPWVGPSGREYYVSSDDCLEWVEGPFGIPPEDFAGLAERLFAQHNRPNEEAD